MLAHGTSDRLYGSPNMDSTTGAASGGRVAADPAVVCRLTELFTREPELILAYLEAHEPPADAHNASVDTILAAACQATNQRPTYADIHYYTARAALQANQIATAGELLQTALQLNPHYNDALILMARICAARNEQNAAINYLHHALYNGADYADVHLLLGDLWRQCDQVTLARQAYRRALDLNANLSAARRGLETFTRDIPHGGSHELPA
ncbi:MAG: tetratricopeptide repeat protein [Planctomycetota bacterium]